MSITTDTEKRVLHVLRNPHGINIDEIRSNSLAAADMIERYKDAYENMRQYAIDCGLDVTARNR